MTKRLPFRAWYYFRQGWGVYFAFMMAAINTLTVTYFLAIERYPLLQEIFPTFTHYIVIITVIGIPLLILVGYAHYKKTPSFKAEAAIAWESNPYARRGLVNSELNLKLNLKILQIILKLSNNAKVSQEELDEIVKYYNELIAMMKERTLEAGKDIDYFKEIQKL